MLTSNFTTSATIYEVIEMKKKAGELMDKQWCLNDVKRLVNPDNIYILCVVPPALIHSMLCSSDHSRAEDEGAAYQEYLEFAEEMTTKYK